MKKLLFTAFLSSFLLSPHVQARTIYTNEHVKIIENLNGDKSQLFNKSKKWVASNFNSAQDVIQYESPEEGQLIIRGIASPLCDSTVSKLKCNGYSQAKISFNLAIDLKDKRARLKFSNYGYARFGNTPIDDPITYKLMLNRFDSLSGDFEKTLSESTNSDSSW
ncbi:DUF4468 domain-containing protein [Acinetobacter seifertii]|uniref:DUF4468 domain-containing protein n=1 Tax=Acinetobacter seifertii TaxID=1530123 RepID=UPI0018FF84D7|nr:DUF4468 domain-containing protein [Acinetobacter seifertii]MBJ8503590.1 DUF4468 domain-containing protein [Acinetobacter seifertii]